VPAIEAGHRPPPAGRRCTGRTPHGPVPSRGECATSAIAKIEPAGQRSSESIKVKAWPKSGAQPAAKRLVTENARTQLRSAVSAETRRPAPGTAPRYRGHGLKGTPGPRQKGMTCGYFHAIARNVSAETPAATAAAVRRCRKGRPTSRRIRPVRGRCPPARMTGRRDGLAAWCPVVWRSAGLRHGTRVGWALTGAAGAGLIGSAVFRVHLQSAVRPDRPPPIRPVLRCYRNDHAGNHGAGRRGL
jgi:hypothetical protein